MRRWQRRQADRAPKADLEQASIAVMTAVSPMDALRAASRPTVAMPAGPRMLLAGATGSLGNEVLNRLVGGQSYAQVQVLAQSPYIEAVRGMQLLQVPGNELSRWPQVVADVGVIMFEPPRAFYQRERALWTPQPQQLGGVARWMHGCGVKSLAVVLPHEMGRLPEAVKHGLANLDEHEVAALGFERLIFVRSAMEAPRPAPADFLQSVAQMLFSAWSYMVPSTERPVRAVHVARLVDAALNQAPAGIHVAPPELVWRSAQKNALQPELKAWLDRG
ncbi:NAD(P)-binding domain-containing protein [Comamonas aquatilis]